MEKEKIKKTRKLIFFLLLIVFIIVILKLMPLFTSLATYEGRASFSVRIKSLGLSGAFLILLLEICKIVVVFLPGEPIELLSGMCFGPVLGTLIIYVGVIFTTILIYKAVKKYGMDLVEDIVPEDKFKRIQDMLKNKSAAVETTLFVLYFLPLVPKDFLTYIGSLLPIRFSKFLFITLFARFPAIISSTVVGGSILDGDVKKIIFAYVITYCISLSIAYVYNKKFKVEVREKRKKEKKVRNDG